MHIQYRFGNDDDRIFLSARTQLIIARCIYSSFDKISSKFSNSVWDKHKQNTTRMCDKLIIDVFKAWLIDSFCKQLQLHKINEKYINWK